jgi:hypothetical protein
MALTGPEQNGLKNDNSFRYVTCTELGQATSGRKETQVYDLRNDEALPNLQTATNEKGAYRYRTMRLR